MTAPNKISSRERHWLAGLGPRALEAIEKIDAITIARVHGHAIGGGVLLALACDLRIAVEDTVFQIPEIDVGSPLDWKGIPRLVFEVGLTRARELVLLSERLSAGQALEYGLLNKVVPLNQLDVTIGEWANRLAGKSETLLRMSKAQFRACTATLALGDVGGFESSLLLEALREEKADEH